MLYVHYTLWHTEREYLSLWFCWVGDFGEVLALTTKRIEIDYS